MEFAVGLTIVLYAFHAAAADGVVQQDTEHTREPKDVCGDWLVCMHEYEGLQLQRIAKSAGIVDEIGETWRSAVHQYQLRKAGELAFGYGYFVCEQWLYPEGYHSPWQVWMDSSLVLCIMMFLLLFSGLVRLVGYAVAKALSRRARLKGCVNVFIFGLFWSLLASQSLFIPVLLAKLHVFPYLGSTCSSLFGPEAHNEGNGRALWAAALQRSNALSGEYYAIFSEFNQPHKQGHGHHEGLVATTMLVYTAQGVLADNLTSTCSRFTRGESAIGSVMPELHRWLDRGGFGCRVVTDFVTQRATMFVSHPLMNVYRLQLLSAVQASKIIELAEGHAAKHEWTTSRHAKYATTDIPIDITVELRRYMAESGLRHDVPQAIAQAYGDQRLAGWGLTTREAFVVKYGGNCSGAVCGQRHLDVHRDGGRHTAISFNVLLSSLSDFKGGGTWLEVYGATGSVDQGMAITHASKLQHGGSEIFSGTRYILVGFLEYPSMVTPQFFYTLRALKNELQRHDFAFAAIDRAFPGGFEEVLYRVLHVFFYFFSSTPEGMLDMLHKGHFEAVNLSPKVARSLQGALERIKADAEVANKGAISGVGDNSGRQPEL